MDNHRRPWTEHDLAELVRLNSERRTLAEMAHALGRSRMTVAVMRTKHGLSFAAPDCAYCEGPVEQNPRGRKKIYCDPLCREAHASEQEHQARLDAYGTRFCRHCSTQLVPWQALYCSRVCGQAAWHRKVMSDPVSKARRYQMLKANKVAREAVTA